MSATALALAWVSVQAQDNEAAWRQTLEDIRPSVVALRVNQTRAFDTEPDMMLDGTGFVVDAENGIILTNRHIVSTGPIRAEALFANQEEIELTRIYADPVHDFGFLRYDPAHLRYVRPKGIELVPDGAQLGREIRVVGNDAGEQFSVLAGTIARLDRKAPDYGFAGYNDFNTFYIQAASSTSGGSSGSPVIDIQGRAVGLNAGGQMQAASSYFLPLHRVRRALELLRQDQPVPRGGLLTTFEQLSYDELRRRGLDEASEAAARAARPDSSGLLVVRSTLRASPAASHLKPGDIVLGIEDERFPDFVRLEGVLDGRVGQTVTLDVARRGDKREVAVEVSDLHAVTPAEYITFGGAIVHPTSYQQARHFNVPLDTIYVADSGYMLGRAEIYDSAILREINGHPLQSLDDVEQALAGLGHDEIAQFRFSLPGNPESVHFGSARTGRDWFSAERCKRDGGDWSCRALAAPTSEARAQPRTTEPRRFDDPLLHGIAPSLVHVRYDMPYFLADSGGQPYSGAGVIVDAERGWVVVDRSTVPETVGDAVLTFHSTIEVKADVAYLHPVHNLAVLRYDPALLGDTPVRAAPFSSRLPETGEAVFLAGYRPDLEPVIRSGEAGNLHFAGANTELLQVNNADEPLAGVLLDASGNVAALWNSLGAGEAGEPAGAIGALPIAHVRTMLDHLRREAPWRSLEVYWRPEPLSLALRQGLPEHWRARVEAHDEERRQVLAVASPVAGTPAARAMRPGDLLLTINGRLATRPQQVESALAGHAEASVVVWRGGDEVELTLDLVELDWQGVREVLFWAGGIVRDPPRDMAGDLAIEPQGVVIVPYASGSPVERYLMPAEFLQVTSVKGMPTGNLTEFAAMLEATGDARTLQVDGILPTGATETVSIKLDRKYWPSSRLRYTNGRWERIRLNQ